MADTTGDRRQGSWKTWLKGWEAWEADEATQEGVPEVWRAGCNGESNAGQESGNGDKIPQQTGQDPEHSSSLFGASKTAVGSGLETKEEPASRQSTFEQAWTWWLWEQQPSQLKDSYQLTHKQKTCCQWCSAVRPPWCWEAVKLKHQQKGPKYTANANEEVIGNHNAGKDKWKMHKTNWL